MLPEEDNGEPVRSHSRARFEPVRLSEREPSHVSIVVGKNHDLTPETQANVANVFVTLDVFDGLLMSVLADSARLDGLRTLLGFFFFLAVLLSLPVANSSAVLLCLELLLFNKMIMKLDRVRQSRCRRVLLGRSRGPRPDLHQI